MRSEYFKHYSYNLNRDMEFKIFGHAGIIFLVFPAQDGRFFDYENFQMIDAASYYIENGLVRFCCVDSIDKESWSDVNGDESYRAGMMEAYFRYINDELYPYLYELNKVVYACKDFDCYTTGCSMGATHALNFFLRRPDLYHGTIALSGIYHASYFFENYHDSRIYDNSIIDYLGNMPLDHPYLPLYRESKIVICSGRGAYEDEIIPDTEKVTELMARLDVPCWVDFWGYDVNHDWPWWRKQIAYFLQFFVG